MCYFVANLSITCKGDELSIATNLVTAPDAKNLTVYLEPFFARKVMPVVV